MTREELYALIKVLEDDLSDGIHFGSLRNDDALKLVYMALKKQEAVE